MVTKLKSKESNMMLPLSKETHKAFKMHCLVKGISMKKLAEKLLMAEVGKK
jgi:predicted HicB family RNase H-like nuclease